MDELEGYKYGASWAVRGGWRHRSETASLGNGPDGLKGGGGAWEPGWGGGVNFSSFLSGCA